MFIVFLLYFIQGVLRFNLVIFGCLQGARPDKGPICCKCNSGRMQRWHLYTARHVAKAAKAATAYHAKHGIVDSDMG